MDAHNYYFLENMTGDNQMVRANDDEEEAGSEAETFVAGYEADGSIIEGFAGKKKLKRKLRRARRRARRAENQLANTRSSSYWDGWWDSHRSDDYYNRPVYYSQPVYVPVSSGDSGNDSGNGSNGGGSHSDMPWVIFAGLVFIVFVILMIMLATRN